MMTRSILVQDAEILPDTGVDGNGRRCSDARTAGFEKRESGGQREKQGSLPTAAGSLAPEPLPRNLVLGVLQPGAFYHVLQQHARGDRTDAAGHGCNGPGYFLGRFSVDIPE